MPRHDSESRKQPLWPAYTPRVARHCVLEHARNVTSSDVPCHGLLQFYMDEGSTEVECKHVQRCAALSVEASYFSLP